MKNRIDPAMAALEKEASLVNHLLELKKKDPSAYDKEVQDLRRIFSGIPPANNQYFGMGEEVVDSILLQLDEDSSVVSFDDETAVMTRDDIEEVLGTDPDELAFMGDENVFVPMADVDQDELERAMRPGRFPTF